MRESIGKYYIDNIYEGIFDYNTHNTLSKTHDF